MTALSPVEQANAAQREASAPEVSAFVSASAGSGKTKLLTDRLLRLMLAGTRPDRIQCLTFTKAAAAEMAMRLQRRLGKWVTMDDADLDGELAEIGVSPGDEVRRTARALFAEVLDLPGGMRIGTIHAFCQSLLRRFPLEAALSPHFTLSDDRDAEEAWQAARETMLADAAGSPLGGYLDSVAPWGSLESFGGLVQSLARDAERMAALAHLSGPALIETLRRVLGAREFSAEDAASGVDADRLRPQLLTIAERGSPSVQERAIRLLDWLGCELSDRARLWSDWVGEFFDKAGKERSFGSFPNQKIRPLLPDFEADLLREQARIAAIQDADRAWRLAPIAAAFIILARPVLESYSAGKSHHGRLDYDDLIVRTEQLLRNPGAAWVLFKLDGGLDHLLLDEVQDTAPAQWRIAGQLTDEFFAGLGARGNASRTVFAVGDRKQSIYGFQGADPDAFEHWRERTGARVRQSGELWRDVPLNVSFRSAAPVLTLVDTVFAAPSAKRGVVEAGETLSHVVQREGVAGRIELWPLAEAQADAPPDFWAAPRVNRGQRNPMQVLAEALAHGIRQWLDAGERLESQDRALRPGDILVLVRRRNAFCNAFVNALKAKGIPVAGLDRIVLTEEPAVQDMLALCDALLLPEDDLSLASVLSSPLGHLSDDDLMRLAIDRTGTLWQALQASDAPCCVASRDFLRQLFARVDHVSPHALLAEALGPLGGRARLLARFGHEAAEPLDELLAAALRYGQSHPPSLQGFVHWLRQTAASVKREPEGAGGEALDAVRIMTVHGAKGLQAPLVILPDTTGKPPLDRGVVWLHDAASGLELPVWCPSASLRCNSVEAARGGGANAQEEERNRLLYVALTRAEDRLLICGWKGRNNIEANCWYRQIEAGFDALGIARLPHVGGKDGYPAEIRVRETAQIAPPKKPRAAEARDVAALPDWVGRAPAWLPHAAPAEPALPQPLAPSRPEGASLGEVPEADSPLLARDTSGQRFRRGQAAHALLQHLPDLPDDARRDAALRYIRAALPDLRGAEALVAEVLAVLCHPDLAPLFGPGSRAEAPVSGVVAGQVIGGLIDRLAVLPDRVLVADYKTNRNPPESAARAPVLYLRQMAAYRALLREIFPGREIVCALIWTVGARPMLLPSALLDGHAPNAGRGGGGVA
jgi:ATP-dependent helicase/nuclease subunit A